MMFFMMFMMSMVRSLDFDISVRSCGFMVVVVRDGCANCDQNGENCELEQKCININCIDVNLCLQLKTFCLVSNLRYDLRGSGGMNL